MKNQWSIGALRLYKLNHSNLQIQPFISKFRKNQTKKVAEKTSKDKKFRLLLITILSRLQESEIKTCASIIDNDKYKLT
jgi:hypothetical protein